MGRVWEWFKVFHSWLFEKWWELLELLTPQEALCIILIPRFSHYSPRCHFCILMPTIFWHQFN